MNGRNFFYLSFSFSLRYFSSSETYTSGREDIGMGHTKSFGVLSWNARQKTGSTASVRCQRSRQRGPEKVRPKKILECEQSILNLSNEFFSIKKNIETIKQSRNQIFFYHRHDIDEQGSSKKNQLISVIIVPVFSLD